MPSTLPLPTLPTPRTGPARSRGAARTARAVLAAAAVAGTLLGCVGCVGYNVYPPEKGVGGFTNPNSDPIPPIMTEAVRWAITRYPAVEPAEWSPPLGVPPEGSRFAVNLPVGVNHLVYTRVVDRIGFGAVPMEPGNEHLPTYYVSRVWVSGDEAKVELIRPVPGIPPTADGHPATQGITVRLRGGLEPWHVTSHRVWAINALPVPPLNYVPGADQYVPLLGTAPAADGEKAEPIDLPGADDQAPATTAPQP